MQRKLRRKLTVTQLRMQQIKSRAAQIRRQQREELKNIIRKRKLKEEAKARKQKDKEKAEKKKQLAAKKAAKKRSRAEKRRIKDRRKDIKKKAYKPEDYSKNFLAVLSQFNLDNMKFIEVGAYDGVSGDPIHEYIVKHNWRGILIEPHKEAFDLLVKNYEGREGLVFENIAIHPTLKKTFLHVAKKRSTSSLSRKMITGKRASVEPVECCRLDELMKKHNAYDIDFVQIDAEGLDFEVIQTIPFSKCKPKIIHYEHVYVDNRSCNKFLYKLGYTVVMDAKDATAYLKPA